MPKLGMYMEDVLLLEWLVAEGAAVACGDVLFALETEKTTAEVEAEADGYLHRTVEAGTKVPIGAAVGLLAQTRAEYEEFVTPDRGDGNPFLASIASRAATVGEAPPPALPAGRSLASPRARRALARNGGSPDALRVIVGTGPGGRILERDVAAHLAAAASAPAAPAVLETIPLRGRRGAIARRMAESLQTAAQLTSVLEVDASALVAARRRLGLSYTALLVRVVSSALRRHPLLNSRVVGDAVELMADVNVGVAVDTEEGLIVPVVHGADRLEIRELAQWIGDLVERARVGALGLAEVEGGTFTLSNAGIHPVDITTAILNPPQSAILWVGRVRDRPIAIDGGLHVRPTVQLCLTFDHRAIDGAPAAAFLGTLEKSLAGLGEVS